MASTNNTAMSFASPSFKANRIFKNFAAPALCALLAMAAARAEKPGGAEDPLHSAAPDPIGGYYTGAFGPTKITVRLEKIDGNNVSGFSLVDGVERPFSGMLSRDANGTVFTLREPGDDKHDGVFKFSLANGAQPRLVGTWVENETHIKVDFDLPKREFKYDPTVGQHPETSTRRLTEKDVENVKKEDLWLMRNEIYARHGLSFNLTGEKAPPFGKLEWYMPVTLNVRGSLTDLEIANESLLQRYENYNKARATSFGR